jgi:cytochrome d ubiquinol oxidase subunit II
MYFLNNINNEKISFRAKTQLKKDAILFIGFFVLFVIALLATTGVAYNANGFFTVKYKFLLNFLNSPVLLVSFLIGTIMVLYAIFISIFKNSKKGIWFSGIGTVLVVLSLLCLLGFNNTSIYPSISNLQSSLNIQNSSSSKYTLVTMGYVSLLVPFVLAYIIFVWRIMDRKKITLDEVKSDSHGY